MFGCACFPLLRPYSKHKLDYCSRECVYFVRSDFHKGYLCLDKDNSKVYVSKHIMFDESVFPFHNVCLALLASSPALPIVTLPSYILFSPFLSNALVSQELSTLSLASPLNLQTGSLVTTYDTSSQHENNVPLAIVSLGQFGANVVSSG